MSLLSFLFDLNANSDNRSVAKETAATTTAEWQKLLEEMRGIYGPYIGWGEEAGGALNTMLLGNDPKFNELFDRYKNSMGYQTTLNAGVDALNTNASNRMLLNSGSNLKNISNHGQETNQKYLGDFQDRLFDQQKVGLAAGSGMSGALQNYGTAFTGIQDNLAQARMNANTGNANAFANFENQAMNAMMRLFGGGGGFG